LKRRKSITAGELLEQLAHDEDYQRRMAALEAELAPLYAAVRADEAELVEEIRQLGFDIESVWDLVNNKAHPVLQPRFTGPYPEAYPILVAHLARPHHQRIREGIIRALTERDAASIATEPLLRELHTERNQMTRWVIANALRVLVPSKARRNLPEIDEAYRAGSGL
jgi:hypothetical protein